MTQFVLWTYRHAQDSGRRLHTALFGLPHNARLDSTPGVAEYDPEQLLLYLSDSSTNLVKLMSAKQEMSSLLGLNMLNSMY
jgi:hypothetical protein